MVGFILVICLYLLITLAFPLYAMLSKSFSTYAFDLTNFEFQVNTGDGWSETFSAASMNEQGQKFKPEGPGHQLRWATRADRVLPRFQFSQSHAVQAPAGQRRYLVSCLVPNASTTPTGTSTVRTISDAS